MLRARERGRTVGNVYNNANWSNQDLTNRDLSNSVLNGCSFSNAEVSGSSFANAVLNNCGFSNASLDGCDFRNAVLNSCTFSNADVESADFSGAGINNCTFHNVDTDSAIGLVLATSDLGQYDNSWGGTFIGSGGQDVTSFSGSSVVMSQGGTVFGNVNGVSISGGAGVRLVSGGVSYMPFDPWIRIFSDDKGYRIECPGTNIRVNGSYTFVNNLRFLHVGQSFPGTLLVTSGRLVDNQYVKKNSWELPAGQWCEIDNSHY